MHDLLRDLALSKAKEENLLDVYEGNANNPGLSTKSRRHATHSMITRYFSLDHSNPRLRSLLVCNPGSYLTLDSNWKFGFKVLRVLDLNRISFESNFPDEIGNLIHLRYLSIGEVRLPASIGNLVMLQTLDIRLGEFKLPDVIWKMKRLRYIRSYISEHLRLDTLEELQHLKVIHADIWMNSCSANLNSLRKLKIVDILSSHGEAILDSIAKLSSSLQSLSLMTKRDRDSFPTLVPLSRCYNLYKLTLRGKIERLPDSHHEFPPKLTTLKLICSGIEKDPMPLLSTLPNLTRLCLAKNSHKGREIVCPRKGFPQLQYLALQRLTKLEELTVEEGTMPNLRVLFIGVCNELMMVPKGLRFLTTLQELEIGNMPEEFMSRLKEDD